MSFQSWEVAILSLCVLIGLSTIGPVTSATGESSGVETEWEWTVSLNESKWEPVTTSRFISDEGYAYAGLTGFNSNEGVVQVLKVGDDEKIMWRTEINIDRDDVFVSDIGSSESIIVVELAFEENLDDEEYLILSKGGDLLNKNENTFLPVDVGLPDSYNDDLVGLSLTGFYEMNYTQTDLRVTKKDYNGTPQWSVPISGDVEYAALDDNSGLLLADYDDSSHRIRAYDSAGKLSWKHEYPSEDADTTVCDNLIISADNHDPPTVILNTNGTVLNRLGVDFNSYSSTTEWGSRCMIAGAEKTAVVNSQGAVLNEFDIELTETITSDSGIILAGHNQTLKVNDESETMWKIQTQAPVYTGKISDGNVYLSGGDFGSNTSTVAILNESSGDILLQNLVTHPDLGSSFENFAEVDSQSYLVSESGFGVMKIDRSGELMWHVSQNDSYYLNESESYDQSKLGQLDLLYPRRLSGSGIDYISLNEDRYFLLNDNYITVINSDGDVLLNNEPLQGPKGGLLTSLGIERTESNYIYVSYNSPGSVKIAKLADNSPFSLPESKSSNAILDRVIPDFLSGESSDSQVGVDPIISEPDTNTSQITFRNSENVTPLPTTTGASVGETQSDSGEGGGGDVFDQLLPSGSGETTTALLASYVFGSAMFAVMITFVAVVIYREYY